MDNLEEFLGASPEAAEVTPEPVEAKAQEPEVEAPEGETKPERPRGPDGKFAKKEEPVMVPLQALHETRDELKALKVELEALRQPKPAPEATPVPDVFEDPQGYTQHLQSQISQVALDTRLNLSEELVRQSAGDEIVNAAQEWGKQQLASNPALAQAFYSNRNPYGFLVKEYQRQQTLAELGDDPTLIEEFKTWRAARNAPQPAPAPTPEIPNTLADAQSARGSSAVAFHVPTLDEILKR